MKKYDVTLTAHYRKTVSVYAESPEQAKEKTKIILFDTDLINFTDDDFVCGEADITEQSEDGLDGAGDFVGNGLVFSIGSFSFACVRLCSIGR